MQILIGSAFTMAYNLHMTAKRRINPISKRDYAKLLRRVVVDPNIYAGEPVIRGTRTHVAIILDSLAAGMSTREIIADYPQLTPEDIQAALVYASELLRASA